MTFNELIESFKNEDCIYIQTHNYPDHDAVASAYGLQYYFSQLGIISHLIYEGDIQRDSLANMIQKLDIDIQHNLQHDITAGHKIVIVDGCKYNKNVTDLIGDEVAVIDHHEVEHPEDVPFADIRPGYGACSTIIYEYIKEAHLELPKNVATALMIGIDMDTSLLTRGVSKNDIIAYADLYSISDVKLENSILRNYIQTKDLDFYKYALDNVHIEKEVAFCYFEKGCNQNLLGILGDFFLALEEVDFVILCAKNENKINFSLQNERNEWNASTIIHTLLENIGFGGGHAEMAGGIIKDVSLFNKDAIFNNIMQILYTD